MIGACFFIHMSHEGNTKYKEGEGGFEQVTYMLFTSP